MYQRFSIDSYAVMWFVFSLILAGFYSIFAILIGWTASIWWVWRFNIVDYLLRFFIVAPLFGVFLGGLFTYRKLKSSGERGKFLAIVAMIIPCIITIFIASILHKAYTCVGPCS